MQFKIDPAIFSNNPGLHIGLIVIKDVNNTGSYPEITEKLRSSEQNICSKMNTDTFKEHPHIAAMQEAHRRFGNNPNKFPPSVQALVKRILKGGQLPSINPLVDIYNIVSLSHVLCAGCEDLDICQGDIQLTYAIGTEDFTPLGETENDPPQEGEIVYKDDYGVICRKLNWREGGRTALTESTKNALLVLEALPPASVELLQNALDELETLVQQYCGGTAVQHILSERLLCAEL